MGGNALKNTNCVRINKNLYEKIKEDILGKLLAYLFIDFVPEAPEKESFGDIDFIYRANSNMNLPKIINDEFSPKETFINGDCYSFSYKINETDYVQIDLIKVSNFNMAKFYFSYGDLGNIVGRMTKKHDLTLGHEGLWTTYEMERVMLFTDPEPICKFLNLNYEKWRNGFKTKKELFNWYTSCKYFERSIFTYENLNYYYKHRYNTRPQFKEFMDYIEKLPYIWELEKRETVIDYLNMFNKIKEKEEIDKKIAIQKLHHEKFSGKVFMLYVEPKKINDYKKRFKEYISTYFDFDEWLNNNDVLFINKKIKEFCQISV